ncbi:DNA topoisomerase IV subunit A [Kurthia massiliensis]|uniref:DNA topoisomerase IV subunit A n=1 Tax=Kurthia massiliensis TaxID=1033739 RepID=UPI000287ECBA|nr:DNA topoisomerase IV subunit A [Kurthia massiliensis]
MAESYQNLPLEDVIGDRFGRYSKYIIQDRALPDARDGLKPVQRRILYAMFNEGNTAEKPFRKSAKTVGNVIGNYHPHGDTSVYEAMVRMSQDWKSSMPLIEMHGNNGSLDGDPPAAMRYTEARLSKISAELLRDLQKETVEFIPNFDDQDLEPTVLPARFPNLLVNGATGISAGYATDIPPHALHEVIDAALLYLKKPTATVDELMEVLPGPDFPTGGIIQGADGIKKAYETGRGKIIVRSKTEIEKLKGSKEQIVITEIPFDVNKAHLVKKMDDLRVDKRLDGIAEVRDESDRQGLRIVVEMKKDMPAAPLLPFLFKNTDLQVTYNFNMIAIHNRRPTMMTLPLLLESYVEHQKEVITRRSQFDLRKAKARLHIVEGLMKALSILDKVIAAIRASKDKKDAKHNLVTQFAFSEEQAEAIVSLQLYRLTNTDITDLQEEQKELNEFVAELEAILADPKKLVAVLRKELNAIKKAFKTERKSVIEAEVQEIKVDMDVLIPSEEVVVSVTKDGYIKRTSPRSYKSSNGKDLAMKESDHLFYKAFINTQQHVMLFTNKGHYILQLVHELPDIRWKDLGQHISSIVPLDPDEQLIAVEGITDFNADRYVVTVTKNGQIKRTALQEYLITRFNKSYKAMNVKKGDELVFAQVVDAKDKDIILVTRDGYGLRFPMEEVAPTSTRTAGIKAANLKDDDYIVSVVVADTNDEGDVLIVTHRGAVKRMHIHDFELTGRAKRGLTILRELKTKPHKIRDVRRVLSTDTVVIETEKGVPETLLVSKYRHAERYSNGQFVIDCDADGDITYIEVVPQES